MCIGESHLGKKNFEFEFEFAVFCFCGYIISSEHIAE